MSLGDSRLNKPVTKDMHTYDDNCDWEWINIWDNLDHYFLTHCLSWFSVSLMLRDAWVLNLWQIWDEVIELSWQHILPHFRECWWDHVILDILLSNSLFIIVGTWVTRYFKMDQFDWLGRSGKSFRNWEIWTNPHHFGATIAILSIVTVNFLDGFFLMNSLWTPPLCWMPISRLFFWFIIGTLAWKEQWSALEGKQVSGKMRYLCVWTIFIESFVSLKFLQNSGNIQYVDTPWYILYPWIILIVGSFSYYIYLRITYPDKKPHIQINERKIEKSKKL